MKTAFVLLLICVLMAATAQAAPKRAIAGALLGAAAGLVLGNNVDWVDQEIAAPVLGVAGAWIGHEMDQTRREAKRARRSMPAAPSPRRASVPDLHPGVDLVKVSILHSNGVRSDIPVLRMNDRFVGPKGEEYESLPTAEMLTERYGM